MNSEASSRWVGRWVVSILLSAGIWADAAADSDVYVAKLLCFEKVSEGTFVRTGQYATVVNIYNPNNFVVQFDKKASRAKLERKQNQWDPEIDVSRPVPHILRPMETMAVDCNDMRSLYVPRANSAFYDGVLEVRVTMPPGEPVPPLIVDRVTTAEKRASPTGEDDDIETIDIDRVEPLRIFDQTFPAGTN